MSPLFGWVAKVSPGGWRGSERAKEESWKTGLKTGVKNGVKNEAPAALRGCGGGKVRVKTRPGVLREHLTASPLLGSDSFLSFFLAFVEFIESGRLVYDAGLS